MEVLNSITFLYPYVFLLFIIYFISIIYFKPKYQKIYFSNIAMLHSVTKANNTFLSILKFLIFLSLIFALSSPVKKEKININDNQGYEISTNVRC